MSQHTQVQIPANARAALEKAAKVVPAVAATRAAVKIPARIGLGIIGVLQIAFAFLAFWDLAQRPAEDVKGPKPVWIPVILVNWIGPAAYFIFGIKR